MPEINAIRFKSAPWSIPRINPAHFTVERFAAVIADTAELYPSETDAASRADFVWLDVACIDQTPGSREKAREIGRQARIFRGAAQVFVWLTTHDESYCTTWASEMEPLFQLLCGPNFHTDVDIWDWVREVTKFFADLLADPWFSSLWTLQETFLSPNAVIIQGDAMKCGIGLFRLRYLSETLQIIKRALDYNDEIRRADKECGLSAMIDRSGLLVCLDQDSMGLLGAAGSRTTRHEEDRVYGIMQVFGFQLGNSAPDVDVNYTFSLEELNDQLGAALLEKDPIASQMHIHQGRVEPSKGWRFDKNSITPSVCKVFHHRKQTQPKIEIRVTLACQRLDGSLWGRFSGLTIPFRVFGQRFSHHRPNEIFYGGTSILLDREYLDKCPKGDLATMSSRAAFLESFTPEVTVLLLGMQSGPRSGSLKDGRFAVGLLLHQRSSLESDVTTQVTIWKRIGLFQWNTDSETLEEEATRVKETFKLLAEANAKTTTKTLSYLKGQGSEWKKKSGLFG